MLDRNFTLSPLFSGRPFFLITFLIICIFYWPTHTAILIDDGISGLWEIQTQGWRGYLQSYGIKGFYYGHYGLLALFYFLFHLNTTYWFILLAALFALNTTLIESVFRKLYRIHKLDHGDLIARGGAFLFLLSPFQLENITWGATLHYNVCLLFLLLMLRIILNLHLNLTQVILLCTLYALSLLMLEVSFFFPMVLGIFLIATSHRESNFSLAKKFARMILPLFLLIGLYLVAYYIKNHSWIPHREEAPLQIHLADVITHLGQFLLKQLALIHFLPYEKRSYVYDLCLHWKRTALILAAFIGFISALLFYFRRRELKTLWVLWTSYFVISFPFLLFYFMYLFRYENDRYLFFGSVFLLQSLVLLFFSFGKKPGLVLTFLLLITYAFFIPGGVRSKAMAGRVHTHIIQTLPRPKLGEHFYFLNLPNYCSDHYEFRANYRLPIALEVAYQQNYEKQITPLMYYYGIGEQDSFTVSHPREKVVELQSKTNGVWWMYESVGASSYENDLWKITMKEWSIELELKRPLQPTEKVFLYSKGQFYPISVR